MAVEPSAILEKRMSDALAVRSKSGRKIPRNFDGFILKFPKINAALERLHEVHSTFESEGEEGISMGDLRAALKQLEVTVTEEELHTIFQHAECEIGDSTDAAAAAAAAAASPSSDQPSIRISFNVFVLCLGTIFLLESADGAQKGRLGSPLMGEAFQIIMDAFVFFDADHDGQLTGEEIEKGFAAHNSVKEGSLLRSLSKRMAEMDRDANGVCTFVEFVNAFVGWVRAQYEEANEEEDDEEGG